MNWNKMKFEKLISKFSDIFKEDEKRQGFIYYENINDSRNLPFELNSILFVKGIADYYKSKIVGIMPYHAQNKILLEILGGELDDIKKSPKLLEKLEIFFRLFILLISCHTGSDVGKIYCRKILIGDLIYSDIVRKHSDVYTLEKSNIIKYWDTYKKAITWTVMYDNKFSKKAPLVYALGEVMYTEGTLYRMSAKHGAKIVKIPFLSNPYLVQRFGNGYEYNIDRLFYEQICKEKKKAIYDVDKAKDVNSLIYDRPSIESSAAFGDTKQIYKREELINLLGVNPRKKNIFIFLHCFSDDSYHETVSIYRDYYCWYIDTINKVKNISNVNWIFREHPMAIAYAEGSVAKRIFDEHKTPNMYWMSKEFNGKNIPQIADAVITVSGTAGVEYSALGIPCVILGKPFYSHYGYTINIKSENEYIDVLNKMDKIHMLSDDKIATAKKILEIYMNCRPVYNTEIEGLISEFRSKFYEGTPYRKAESDFLDEMLNWLEKNEIKESRIYQFGLNVVDDN